MQKLNSIETATGELLIFDDFDTDTFYESIEGLGQTDFSRESAQISTSQPQDFLQTFKTSLKQGVETAAETQALFETAFSPEVYKEKVRQKKEQTRKEMGLRKKGAKKSSFRLPSLPSQYGKKVGIGILGIVGIVAVGVILYFLLKLKKEK